MYCPDRAVLSSTTSLLNYQKGCRTAYPVDVYPAGKANQFYPADLTDSDDCFRLLPNHRLNLNTWQAKRFWPRDKLEPDMRIRTKEHIEQALEHLKSDMLAIHSAGVHVYSPLTAGRDSRIILACTPDKLRSKASYVTLNIPSGRRGDERDLHTSRMLARRHQLNHAVLDIRRSSADDGERYFYNIGRAGGTGKATKFYSTPLEYLDINSIWLMGHGGAVSISHYARRADSSTRPTEDDLLHRANLPQRQDFLAAMSCWMSELPPQCFTELMVALYYMEMRLGGGACPHMYGNAPFCASLSPFSNRSFVEACFAIPYAYRDKNRSRRHMIEIADSRLLHTPFEQAPMLSTIRHWLKLRLRQVKY